MPKQYVLRYLIEDRQAQAAVKRSIKNFVDVEKTATKAATTIEASMGKSAGAAAKGADAIRTGWIAAGTEAKRAGTVFARAGDAGRAAGDKFGAAWKRAAKTMGAELVSAGKAGSAAVEKVSASLRDLQGSTAGATGAVDNFGRRTRGTTESLGGFLAKVVAVRAGGAVFHSLMRESEELEGYWKKLAAEATTFRDALRELASLKGKPGPDDSVTADVLSLARESNMTTDQAAALSQAYENIAPTVREKGHYKPKIGRPEDLERDVLAMVGQTARRLGIDEGAAGEALGTAGLFSTFTTKEDAASKLGTAFKGLSEGKLKYTSGVTALSKGAAKLLDTEEAAAEGASAGKLRDYGEAGIYLGALSLGTGTADQAQHRMVQISRLLNPDASNKGGQVALQRVGLTAEMTDPEKLVRLSKFFKANKVASPADWLASAGLGSVASREALVAGLKVSDVLEARLGKARDDERTGAAGRELLSANEKYSKLPSSVADAVRSRSDVLDKAVGMSGVEMYEQAKAAAEARMQAFDPDYGSPMRGVHEWLATLGSYPIAGVSGKGLRQETDEKYGVQPVLHREAERVGIRDLDERYPNLYASNPRLRAEEFKRAAAEVQGRGGDPLGLKMLDEGAMNKIDELRRALDRNSAALEKAQGKAQGQPQAGRQAPPMLGQPVGAQPGR